MILGIWLAGTCWFPLPTKAAVKRVVLITIDALRSDRLGSYGHALPTTPTMDLLSKQGVLFTDVIAPIPRTTQAVASLMTGQYPTTHGVTRLIGRLDNTAYTLAEVFADHGFETAAFVNHPLQLLTRHNLGQGFMTAQRTNHVVTEVTAWLKTHKTQKFFLWIHLFDPHWPYFPPKPYSFFTLDSPLAFKDYLGYAKQKQGEIIFQNSWPEDARTYATRMYDGEIRYADRQVLSVLRRLQDATGMKKTLVLISSDHGEGMGEHNYYYEHGEVLYEGVVKVPLIALGSPIKKQNYVVDVPVNLVDLFPTVLGFVKIPVPPKIEGLSISKNIKKLKRLRAFRSSNGRCAFGETDVSLFKENPRFFYSGDAGRWKMLRARDLKLIKIPNPDGDEYELYNLATDPGETTNLYNPQDKLSGEITALLEKWIQATQKSALEESKPVVPEEIDEEMVESLRTLGYMN